MNNKRVSECLLVSIDFSPETDTGVLIVGQKAKGKDVEIVNAFQGKEAWELYQRLITKKEKENASRNTES